MQVQGSKECASPGLPCAPGSCAELSALHPYCLQLLLSLQPACKCCACALYVVSGLLSNALGDSQYRKTRHAALVRRSQTARYTIPQNCASEVVINRAVYLLSKAFCLEVPLLQGLQLLLEGIVGGLHLLAPLFQPVRFFFDTCCNACLFF